MARLSVGKVQIFVRPERFRLWLHNRYASDSAYALVTQERGGDSGDDTVPLWSVRKEGISTYYIEERHRNLPSNRAVLEAILELVHGGAPSLPREVPEPSGLFERLRVAPVVQQVLELRRRIEEGEFSREDLQKLFFAR